MAALTAMDRGNARCWALRLRAAEQCAQGGRQASLLELGFQLVGPRAMAAAANAAANALPPSARAARGAAKRFWAELAAWVELSQGDGGGLGPDAPFIGAAADAAGRTRMRVNLPAEARRQQGAAV